MNELAQSINERKWSIFAVPFGHPLFIGLLDVRLLSVLE